MSTDETYARLKGLHEKMAAEAKQFPASASKSCAEENSTPSAGALEDALASVSKHIAQRDAIMIEAFGLFVEIFVKQPKEIKRIWLTTAEFATQAVKDGIRKRLTARTVQKWCREQRLKYKEVAERGPHGEYRISVEEFNRFAREGLLPKNHR
jgi:hypothetical protein